MLKYSRTILTLFTMLCALTACSPFNTNTVFLKAARNNNTQTIKQLIQAGGDINQTNTKGQTALMISAFYGYTSQASWLLQHHANPNTQDVLGNTALMIASTQGNSAIVRLLIQYRANIRLRNRQGTTAAIAAASSGETHSLALLLHQGANLNAKNTAGLTAYQIAKRRSHNGTAAFISQYANKHHTLLNRCWYEQDN